MILQHAPEVPCVLGGIRTEIENKISKLLEQFALQGFSEEIRQHVARWCELNFYVTCLNAIFREEVPEVNML